MYTSYVISIAPGLGGVHDQRLTVAAGNLTSMTVAKGASDV